MAENGNTTVDVIPGSQEKALKRLNKARVYFPVNVRIMHKKTDGQLLHEYEVKNRVTKPIALYSVARFWLGDFANNLLSAQQGDYLPKYLAIGSNEGEMTGAQGTTTSVLVTDRSLYHELDDTPRLGETPRIRVSRANYIEDDGDNDWLKIQYEAYVPEDRYENMKIGELGLMTRQTGWNAFARVTGFEPFIKVPHSVLYVTWEITIVSVESSERLLPPVRTYLREAFEKAVDVLYEFKNDPQDYIGARKALELKLVPGTKVGTGLFYLINNNESITQDVLNNYLSAPFNSLEDCGLISLIHLFDPDWRMPDYEAFLKLGYESSGMVDNILPNSKRYT